MYIKIHHISVQFCSQYDFVIQKAGKAFTNFHCHRSAGQRETQNTPISNFLFILLNHIYQHFSLPWPYSNSPIQNSTHNVPPLAVLTCPLDPVSKYTTLSLNILSIYNSLHNGKDANDAGLRDRAAIALIRT